MATATMTFRYSTREAWIERLAEARDPQSYDLCVTHAARTRPPEGWELRDRRPEDERRPAVPHPTPVDLGGDRTVAVLAAALRAVPDPVSEDAVADHAEVDRAVAETAPFELEEEPALVAAPASEDEPAVATILEADGEPPVATALALDLEADPTREAAGWLRQLADETSNEGRSHDATAAPDVAEVPRPPLAARDRAAAEHG